jgi:hypothetical protein
VFGGAINFIALFLYLRWQATQQSRGQRGEAAGVVTEGLIGAYG